MGTRPGRTISVVSTALVVAASLLGDSFLYVALPLEYKSLGLSLVMVGFLLSANRLVRFFSNTFAGHIYGKRSTKLLLTAAILSSTVINLSYGFAKGFILFLIARLAWGVTWSFLRLGGFLTVVSNADKDNRGLLMGIYQSVSSIGSLLGGLLGGIILDLMGFKPAAIILAAGTALGIPIVFTLKDGSEESVSKTSEVPINLKTILGSPRILSIGIGAMLSSLFMGSIIVSTLSLYLAESFGREGVQIYGMIVGIATLTGFLLMFRLLSRTLFGPIFGPLSDILGRKRTIMILFLMGSISLAILGLSNSLLIVALAVIIIFTSAAGLGVVLTTEVSDIASEESEVSHYVLSAYTNWTDLGSAMGPLTAYILLTGVSFRSLFLGASLVLFIFTLFRTIK